VLRRPTVGTAVVREVVLSLATASLLATGCAWRDVDKSDYVARNEKVLASVPVFPGAVLVRRYTYDWRRDGDLGPITGYATDWTYRVPRDAYRDEVTDFYKRVLPPEWTFMGGNEVNLSFRRGANLLAVSALAGTRDIILKVDYNFPLGPGPPGQ
jgi:hypothetical protein